MDFAKNYRRNPILGSGEIMYHMALKEQNSGVSHALPIKLAQRARFADVLHK